jgi:hypothetical protein
VWDERSRGDNIQRANEEHEKASREKWRFH